MLIYLTKRVKKDQGCYFYPQFPLNSVENKRFLGTWIAHPSPGPRGDDDIF